MPRNSEKNTNSGPRTSLNGSIKVLGQETDEKVQFLGPATVRKLRLLGPYTETVKIVQQRLWPSNRQNGAIYGPRN